MTTFYNYAKTEKCIFLLLKTNVYDTKRGVNKKLLENGLQLLKSNKSFV